MQLFKELPSGGKPHRRRVKPIPCAAEIPFSRAWAQLLLNFERRVKRPATSLDTLIRTDSPQRPACFDSHPQWVSWLLGAHADGRKVVRRVDVGKWSGNRRTWWEVLPVGQQSHCADCTERRRMEMKAQGRCFPVRPPASALAQDAAARDDNPLAWPVVVPL